MKVREVITFSDDESMYIVAETDKTHELKIYEYQYETLEEAEKHFNITPYNALLIKKNNGAEIIIKSK